jgi:phosphatidylglycerophosphatase A
MFKFYEFILTFCYLGNTKKAPGTFGSIGGLLFWLIITKLFFTQNFSIFFQNFLWLLIITIMTIFAVKKINFYVKNLTEKSKSSKSSKANKDQEVDNQSIVLDEVVGQIIALQISLNFIGENYFSQPKLLITHLFLSLILFRFFDIKKPWIIGITDRKMKNPFGVMFDDILSGILAGCLCLLFFTYFKIF